MRPATPAELKTFLAEIEAVKKKRAEPPEPTKPSSGGGCEEVAGGDEENGVLPEVLYLHADCP